MRGWMFRKTTVFLFFCLFLLSTSFVVADPATSTSCGTVTNSLTLTSDIAAEGTCLQIMASNVVIDGGGFSLIGNATGDAFSIDDGGSDFDNITIQNFAFVSNFSGGVTQNEVGISYIRNFTLENLSFSEIKSGNHIRLRLINFTIDNIISHRGDAENFAMVRFLENSTVGTISNSVFNFTGNSAEGRGILLATGNASLGSISYITITNNTFYQTQSTGPEGMVELEAGANHITLSNNHFPNNRRAINIFNSSFVTLENNNVTLGTNEFYLTVNMTNSLNVTFNNNYFDSAGLDSSFTVTNSNYTTFFNNSFVNVGGYDISSTSVWYASYSPLTLSGVDYDTNKSVLLVGNGPTNFIQSDNTEVSAVTDTENYDLFLGWINTSDFPGYPNSPENNTYYLSDELGIPRDCANLIAGFPGSICDFYYQDALVNTGTGSFTAAIATQFNSTFKVIEGNTTPPSLAGVSNTSIVPATGILLEESCFSTWQDNTFRNSTLTDLSGIDCTHNFRYNNTFGSINWDTITNLTFDREISIGDGIYLQDNLIGLADELGLENLNSSAVLTFKNLSASITPVVFKNEIRCDNTDSCNISSYNSTTGNLILNVTSFSNYTTQEPILNCGTISESVILSQNLNATGTCLTVNASGITLNGAGFHLNGDGSGAGINVSGFTNVIIKNFGGINDFATGINLENTSTGSTGHLISNNYITPVANGKAIILTRVQDNRIENNHLNASGSGGWGVSLATLAHNNNITGNTFNIESVSNGYGVALSSISNPYIFNNTFRTTGSGAAAVMSLGSSVNSASILNNVINATHAETLGAVYLRGSNWNISNNVIISRNRGIYLDSTGFHSNNVVSNNNLSDFTSSEITGIEVSGYSSDNLQLVGNIINFTEDNSIGILFSESSGENIEQNVIFLNGSNSYGIILQNSSGLNFTNDSISITSGFLISSNQTSASNQFSNVLLNNNRTISISNLSEVRLAENISSLGTPSGVESINFLLTVNNITSEGLINFTYHYSEEELGNITENSLQFYRYNGSEWSAVSGSSVDTSANTVNSGELTSFSTFGLFGSDGSIYCGTITNDTTLVENISSTGNCFTVNASNIVLDGAGFSLIGNGSGIGINVTGQTNVTIKNFGLENFTEGILLEMTNQSVISNLTVIAANISGADTLRFSSSENNSIINNTLVTLGGSSNGIYIPTGSDSNLIQNNSITTFGSFSPAIFINGADTNTVLNNYISTSGSSAVGISTSANADRNVFQRNIINLSGNSGGILLSNSCDFSIVSNNTLIISSLIGGQGISVGSTNNNVTDNIITYAGSFYGISLSGNGNNYLFNNTVTASQDDAIALRISGENNVITNNSLIATSDAIATTFTTTAVNNFLQGNTLLSENRVVVDLNRTLNNTLFYENSFGSINWTKGNLSTNSNLSIGSTIFLENNLVGFQDGLTMLALNDTAEITINNLSYGSTPQLLRNGQRCDNTNNCNISNYNSSLGVLTATISSFSNYSTQESAIPNVAFTSPTNGATVRSTLSVVASVNSSGTIDSVNLTISNSSSTVLSTELSNTTITSWNTTVNTTDYSDGDYNFTLTANTTTGDTDSETITITFDNTPPNLENVTNTSITSSGALISWVGSEAVNGTVNYGTSVSLGSVENDITFSMSPSVTLSSLSASTLYYYNVTSCDAVGNCNSTGTYNFTTSAASSSSSSSSSGGGGGGSGGGGGGRVIYVCDENSDCGQEQLLQNPFCFNERLYQEYLVPTCQQPGTAASQCVNMTEQREIRSCLNGCQAGKCLTEENVNNTSVGTGAAAGINTPSDNPSSQNRVKAFFIQYHLYLLFLLLALVLIFVVLLGLRWYYHRPRKIRPLKIKRKPVRSLFQEQEWQSKLAHLSKRLYGYHKRVNPQDPQLQQRLAAIHGELTSLERETPMEKKNVITVVPATEGHKGIETKEERRLQEKELKAITKKLSFGNILHSLLPRRKSLSRKRAEKRALVEVKQVLKREGKSVASNDELYQVNRELKRLHEQFTPVPQRTVSPPRKDHSLRYREYAQELASLNEKITKRNPQQQTKAKSKELLALEKELEQVQKELEEN